METSELEAVVLSVLREQFPKADIAKVAIRPDVDDDGDRFLRVVVVLRDASARLDANALVGVVRHLRPRLAEMNRDEFPVLSFVTSHEARHLDLEPA